MMNGERLSWVGVSAGFCAAIACVTGARADDARGPGAAVLEVMPHVDNVQQSNFGNNSFRLINRGGKRIVGFELDVTGALYPDVVFDPEGVAGDSVAKPLRIDTPGGTGIVQGGADRPYVGRGGSAGYEGLRLRFDPASDGGFEPGESLGFSIDMDPNSAAGTRKGPLDDGSYPRWDVGGVSGAELIGSRFTVTFEDGASASGQLHGTATQAGSRGVASEGSPGLRADVRVNGVRPGGAGTYRAEDLRVVVRGPAGRTARVVLTQGFIQPVTPYADFVRGQLESLAREPFPANNAVAFQTVDIVLSGADQDISSRFDVSGAGAYSFSARADRPFSVDDGELPLGVVAAVVDPDDDHLPLGPVTAPVYLVFDSAK